MQQLLQHLLVIHEGLLDRLLALVPTYIIPCRLDGRNSALVDGFHVAPYQIPIHLPRKVTTIQELRFYTVQDTFSQLYDLLKEFRSQLIEIQLIQVLQILLISQRSHKRDAIPLLEEGLNQSTNPILLLNLITESLLNLQCLLQVLLCRYRLIILVNQLQREISHHPKELREVLREIFNRIRSNLLRTKIINILMYALIWMFLVRLTTNDKF